LNNSKNKNNIAAVIPFFNESRTINQIISRTLQYVDHIIAVDDGSTDDYSDNIPQENNVTLLKYDVNRGKGFALAEGLKKGVEKGFKKLITIDADLQHNPDEIPLLISALAESDIVIGNRLGNLSDMPFHRILSNKITSFLLSLKTGQKILDSQCGFRAYNSNVINSVKTNKDGYEAESEMIIKASRKGFKIAFVNISTIYGDEESKMSPVKTTFAFIRVLFI
jgi:UDP-N-acetylglucosamine---dolichyl-phosphate N-acetylglucosaminyltransferase